MFLRAKVRKKDGKRHRYFSVVENRRVGKKRTAQRTVLYLGEINDGQEASWRKTLQVFDESQQRHTTLSLFPEDREIPAEASDSIQVKLSEMELRRPRAFGNCWLGCELWRQLQLEEFWEKQLAEKVKRETVCWAKVLQLLVVNRLLDPGSEFRLHRQWFDQSAMGELLETDFAVAEKDRLYRCLDRIVEHKAALFQHLRERWQDLFQAQFEVLLYDLTSTYIEGEGEQIPQAKYGYSRDQRSDCKQVVIALVITTGRTALNLRSHGWEHVGSNHAAQLSAEDRNPLRSGATGLGNGSGDSDRSGAGGDAPLGAGNFLPGGHATQQGPTVREKVVGSALAEGAGVSGGEAVCRGRRTVRRGQERRAAIERDRHAAEETSSIVA